MPTARLSFSPSSPLAGLAWRRRRCPRPKRVVRRAARRARLRGALSMAGMVGVVGLVALGGFWFLRGPAAVADTGAAGRSIMESAGGPAPAAIVLAGVPTMMVRVEAAPAGVATPDRD